MRGETMYHLAIDIGASSGRHILGWMENGKICTREVYRFENGVRESGANLTISKSICPTIVTENGRLTYTFVIQNIGNTPAVATDDVTITDTFNPILTGLTVTFNGVAWTENVNYTYSEATGEFATIPSQITVPAATYTQDPTTGEWTVDPGIGVLTVTGTV